MHEENVTNLSSSHHHHACPDPHLRLSIQQSMFPAPPQSTLTGKNPSPQSAAHLSPDLSSSLSTLRVTSFMINQTISLSITRIHLRTSSRIQKSIYGTIDKSMSFPSSCERTENSEKRTRIVLAVRGQQSLVVCPRVNSSAW